jgi:hypothetical protein
MFGSPDQGIIPRLARTLKIDLHFDSQRMYQLQVYRRAEQAFKLSNIDCRFMPDCLPSASSSADLFVLQDIVLQDIIADFDLEKLGRPVILEEKCDSSMPMAIARKATQASNVIACLRVAVIKGEWINLPVRRPHAWILDQVEDRPRQIILDDKQIAKFLPGFSFAPPQQNLWVDSGSGRRPNV